MRAFRNYYKILKVGLRATRSEIRRSFRKLAKKYHPDTSELDRESATVRMRILLEAYRILMDNNKRTAYNLRFKAQLREKGISYRDSLRERPDDPYSQALLIFYDLLHGNGSEAIATFERMAGSNGGSFDLLGLLGFADYLDCTFLLAEEYQKRARYEDAARYYEDIFREDLKWNYFRHFRAEIKQQIRDIYCRHLAKLAEPRVAIGYFQKLLSEYDFPKKERAFFHKKIAELYCELDEAGRARDHLNEAFRLRTHLTGTKKLLEHLKTGT